MLSLRYVGGELKIETKQLSKDLKFLDKENKIALILV